MTQLSLLDHTPRARSTDPQTSHQAAARADRFARGHHKLILDYLTSIAPRSAHYVTIAQATGLERHAVGRRLGELANAGLILCTGTLTLPNGNSGRAWTVAKEPERAAA